jgi:hypothetical protein
MTGSDWIDRVTRIDSSHDGGGGKGTSQGGKR